MDFSILFVVRSVLKIKKSILRLIFSAVFGGVYAVTEMIIPHGVIIGTLLTYIIALEIMVLIAFGKVDFRKNLKMILFIYLTAFLLNGIINMLHISDSMWKVLLVVFLTCGLLIIGIKKVFCMIGEQSVLYITKITEENNTICIKALKDTGNNLIDPLTKKPVSIVEKDIMKQLISEKTKMLYVPFKSVGKENGIMEACLVEQMEIEGRKYKNAVIGLFDGKLSAKNEYHMILHPKLFESGGKEFD